MRSGGEESAPGPSIVIRSVQRYSSLWLFEIDRADFLVAKRRRIEIVADFRPPSAAEVGDLGDQGFAGEGRIKIAALAVIDEAHMDIGRPGAGFVSMRVAAWFSSSAKA